jgi:hypothetical protein
MYLNISTRGLILLRILFVRVNFLKADFLEYQFDQSFDIIIASGIFNHKFPNGGNDLFTHGVM